tara:strand:- start:120 stop:2744 length:2625 start_codon:yes stop_codon:yes gene_type:complete
MPSSLGEFLDTASTAYARRGLDVKPRTVKRLNVEPLKTTSVSPGWFAVVENTAMMVAYGATIYCALEEVFIYFAKMPTGAAGNPDLELSASQFVADSLLVTLRDNKALLYAVVLSAGNLGPIMKSLTSPRTTLSDGMTRARDLLAKTKSIGVGLASRDTLTMIAYVFSTVASIAAACHYFSESSRIGDDPSLGTLVSFKTAVSFSDELRRELPNLDSLVIASGIALTHILDAQRVGQSAIPRPIIEPEPVFSPPGRAGFIQLPAGATSEQSGGVLSVINATAKRVVGDSLYLSKAWTDERVIEITAMLVDQSGKPNSVGKKGGRFWFVKEAPGVKWASRDILERATGVSWESLPSSSRGQGMYLFPGELRKMASRQSTRCIFNQNVGFVIDHDERDEVMWMERTQDEYNRDPYGAGVDTPIYPDTVPAITDEEADLLNRIPYPSLFTTTKGAVQVSGDEFFVPQSHWESYLNEVTADLSNMVERSYSSARKRFEAQRQLVARRNERAVSASTDAVEQILGAMDRVEEAERSRFVEKEREEQRRRDTELAGGETTRIDRLLAFGTIVLKLYRAYRNLQTKRENENIRASALTPSNGDFRPSLVPGTRRFRLNGVLPILLWTWKKLYRTVGHRQIEDMSSFETMGARFVDSPPKKQTTYGKSIRRTLRMKDVQQAYDDIVGSTPSEIGEEQLQKLQLVLSDTNKLVVSDRLFWLRMYLWERMCLDEDAPYPAEIKSQLFDKIRIGPEYGSSSECTNPRCTYKTGDSEKQSKYWFTKSGKDWLLIDAPSDVKGGTTLEKYERELRDFADELHDQRRLVGLCAKCVYTNNSDETAALFVSKQLDSLLAEAVDGSARADADAKTVARAALVSEDDGRAK